MRPFHSRAFPYAAVALGALALGAAAGYLAGSYALARDSALQLREGAGRFTNPLLECEVAEGGADEPRTRLEEDLRGEVRRLELSPRVADIGVYFRDLNRGPAFGISETEAFVPASLMKLPVLITFLKRAESDPGFLKQSIPYPGASSISDAVVQRLAPNERLIAGRSYAIEELLERMIRYSDNEALALLWPLLPQREYENLLGKVGLRVENWSDSPDSANVSAEQYSIFLRILFNASFLTQESSERALEMLSRTDFAQGLRAGVPAAIPVAHKFGERSLSASGDSIQLHDCGIVYVPKAPYLLCVMTRGSDADALASAIADVSRFVYERAGDAERAR